MKSSVKSQIRILMEKKITIFMFLAMIAIVLINYFQNVNAYANTAINFMMNPMRLLLLSADAYEAGSLKFIFLQFYPFLVILPAGFSYALDKNSKMEIYLKGRLGGKNYFLGKIIAAFIVTFIIFTIPFLIEMGLNCIAFPLNANGNASYEGVYSTSYLASVEGYLFFGAFKISPYLYSLITILIFGFSSGILAVFTMATSIFLSKYKVLMLLPTYLLLYGLGMLYTILPNTTIHTSYFDYFSMFDISNKNQVIFLTVLILLLVSSILCIMRSARKDTF